MKKIVNISFAILLAFVLTSAIFSASGNVFAQGNTQDEENNENGNANTENQNAGENVNPLTGTTDPAQEVAQNFTEFSNATTPEDVQQQLSTVNDTSVPPYDLGNVNATSGNATSGNATSGNATSGNATGL